MYFQNKIVLLFIVGLTMFSCKQISDSEESVPVVEVDGRVLNVKELNLAIPSNLSHTDSASFAQNYINRWVKKTLLLRKAELNLTENEKDVNQLLEDYRASLLVHKYQQKLLQQKYAPQITHEEIEAYYTDMSENFMLQQNILKGIYIKLPVGAPNLKDVKVLYKSSKPEDEKKLEEYCYQNANKFQDFSDKWTEGTQLSSFMPNALPSDRRFYTKNSMYETSDSLFVYYIFIKEYKLKNEVAPVEYVEGRIEAILLNKKRIEFIQNLEEELFEEGLKQKAIKYYN